MRRPPRSALFPCTTLFRSDVQPSRHPENAAVGVAGDDAVLDAGGGPRLVNSIHERSADSAGVPATDGSGGIRSEEHTPELQSPSNPARRPLPHTHHPQPYP